MNWSDIPRNPSRRTLRQFAGLSLVFFGLLGTVKLATGHSTTGTALLVLGVCLGVLGLSFPALLRPVFVGWMVAVFPVGWLVARLVLALLFYGVFVPLGACFRLAGRDALGLRRRAATSYWQVKPAAAGPANYYRQF